LPFKRGKTIHSQHSKMTAKNKNKKKGPFIRSKKGIALIVLSTVVIVAALFLIFKIEDIAENRLLAVINAELEPNAEIEFGEFSFSLLPAGLTIRDIRLVHLIPFEEHTPTKSSDTIKTFEIKEIGFSGINIYRMLLERQWILDRIRIDGLLFELVPLTTGRLTDATPFQQPPPFLIDKIILSNGRFSIFSERDDDEPRYDIQNIYSEVESFSVPDINDPFHTYFEELTFRSSAFLYNTRNGNYTIGVDSLSTNSREGYLFAKGGKVNPLYSAREMAEKKGYETDQFDVQFETFSMDKFDLKRWFEENDLAASLVRFDEPSISIHRDKSFPREERDERSLPTDHLRNLPFTLQIDSVAIRNGFLSYTEDFVDEGRKGNITFNNVDLTVEKLQNHHHEDSISISVSSRFFDLADLNLSGEFVLQEQSSHTIRGSMSGFDLTQLNQHLEKWVFVRVGKGNADHLDFYFSADEDRALGEMQFIYHDLEIRFLDEDSLEETRNRRLRSFFANLIRVRSGNSADNPRIGTIDFERDKERSVFNYWWKSVASGLKDSVER
jgi:hypothetical protein